MLPMHVARCGYPPFRATTDASSGRHRGFIAVEVAGEGADPDRGD